MGYNRVIPVDAGADLRAHQWKAVQVDGTLATSALNAKGILQNKPNTGEDASLAYDGRSKFYAGGAIADGANMTVGAAGIFTTASSGDRIIGSNVGGAVTSGSIGEDGIFDFAAAGIA